MKVLWRVETLEGRHLNRITMSEVTSPKRLCVVDGWRPRHLRDNFLGARDALRRIELRLPLSSRKLNALDLDGIEDVVALEKEHGLLLLRAVAVLHVLMMATPLHDEGAVFTFANAAAACIHLAESHPPRGRTVQQTEQQDIEALILGAGVEVARAAGDAIPRTAPGHAAM